MRAVLKDALVCFQRRFDMIRGSRALRAMRDAMRSGFLRTNPARYFLSPPFVKCWASKGNL
jgi:hypothetical protein